MGFLDKLISFIFSIVILVLAVVVIMLNLGYADYGVVSGIVQKYIVSKAYGYDATIAGAIFLLAAIKTTIFLSDFRSKDKSPILVDSANGKVEIAQDTIISTVKNVANDFSDIHEVQAKMVKYNKGIKIDVILTAFSDTNIRKLTEEMQQRVKDVIKDTTGIDVVATNVKVRNVYDKKTEKLEKVSNKKEVKEEIKVEETKIEEQKAEENLASENKE